MGAMAMSGMVIAKKAAKYLHHRHGVSKPST
jgi:hypothetical protein